MFPRRFFPGRPAGSGSTIATPALAVVDDGVGSTATATVSSSTAGSTNTIYTRAYEATSWTSSGSRSGDGTVSLTLTAGRHFVVCVSTIIAQSAASNIVSLNISPAAADRSSLNGTRELLLAVRNHLRSGVVAKGMAYANKDCEVMLDGKPPPTCGRKFVSVHQGPQRSVQEGSLDVEHDLYITLTHRLEQPFDRLGARQLVAVNQMENETDAIIASMVDGQYTILNAANVLIGNYDGFCEPLHFRGHDGVKEFGWRWFNATPDENLAALVCTIRFGGARILHRIGNVGN